MNFELYFIIDVFNYVEIEVNFYLGISRGLPMDEYLENLANTLGFFGALLSDLDHSKQILSNDDNQFNRRTYLRTFIASVEGTSFKKRHMALNYHEHMNQIFTPEELTALKEEKIVVDESGKIEIRQHYVSVPANVRFSKEMESKMYQTENTANYQDNSWNCLKLSINKRNKITHPRTQDDLTISDDDLNVIKEAEQWFRQNVI